MSPSPLLNVGVVGATGMVGQEFIKILEQRKFPLQELRLFAGARSEGSTVDFRNQKIEVRTLSEGCFQNLDVVFFSAGADISAEWGPRAVKEGAFAIDNSSAFRMNKNTLLIVPEVNAHLIPASTQPTLIANPNCSTIQLVAMLQPLNKAFGLTQVQVASYQAVSGMGKEAIEELKNQVRQVVQSSASPADLQQNVFPHPIAFNAIPQIGNFNDDGYSEEENKIIDETKKIMDMPQLDVTAFAVRVPTINGHCEAVWVSFEKAVTREEILSALRPAGGIEIVDDPSNNKYPMAITASGRDPVFVGRIRANPHNPKQWLFWIAADNVRKGAALNGIQIAEQIFDLNRGS